MYLKKLVVHGFKSFADRTVIDLERGVTGIVGPNGCGKSNVADAIKWVLGEQSPKSLRASSMQDVLFEGVDTRAPMSFCEVSLLFSDCEKELGTAFNEVEVSRRVERDGGSDYFINGKACRLKDVQNLFRDTGIGRVAYSFLQQGQIDKLLSSNPQDRRAVFEEAAGISGFKSKREETLRKLTETEGNLSRLGDILTEVASSMNSLKRQASRAIRAARFKRQLAALEEALSAFDFRNLNEQVGKRTAEMAPREELLARQQSVLAEKEESLKAAEAALSGLISQQQALSGKIFERRSEREEALSHARFLTLRAEEALSRAQSLRQTSVEMSSEKEKAQAELAVLAATVTEAQGASQRSGENAAAASATHDEAQKSYEDALSEELSLSEAGTTADAELTALQAKLSALELESHSLSGRMGPLKAQRESLEAELRRVEDEAGRLRAQKGSFEGSLVGLSVREAQTLEALEALRIETREQRENFERLQNAHAGLVAEQNLLAQMQRRYEGFTEATQNLLCGGEYAPLVEGLEIEPVAATALAALLSLELDAVCPKSPAAGALQRLSSGEKVALPFLTPVSRVEAASAPEGFEPAAHFIKASPALDFLRARLEGCYVCRDERRFSELLHLGGDFEFVAVASLSGAMLDGRGLFVAAGKSNASSGFLTRAHRLGELEELLEKSAAVLCESKAELVRLEDALADTESVLQKVRAEAASASLQLENFSASLGRSDEQLQRLSQQRSSLEAQMQQGRERLEALELERAGLSSRLEKLLSDKTQNAETVRALAENLASLRDARDAAYAALSESRLAAANARHALEVAEEAERTLKSRAGDLALRLQNSFDELARLQEDEAHYREQATEKTALADASAVALKTLEDELQGLRAELETYEGSTSAARGARETLRRETTELQEALMRERLALGELTARRNLLQEEFQKRTGAQADLSALDYRQKLFEAEYFARADEASLELGSLEVPAEDVLQERYGLFDREKTAGEMLGIRQRLESFGPINESALEDYKAQEARYTTLKTQVDDLQLAKTELTAALAELNAQSSTLFATTFEAIRANFHKTFEALFGGGKADLLLSDPSDALNSGIEIMARPPGTQLKSLGLLSGGQKTMTAVALLFAIYQVKPSPFCVLDELDAPLDDANIGRFLEMLRGFTAFSQFVMITHNKRTMASCNVLYGVTMQERGVSRVLSMRLSQAESYSKPSPRDADSVEPREAAQESAQELLDANLAAAIAHTEAPSASEVVVQASEAVSQELPAEVLQAQLNRRAALAPEEVPAAESVVEKAAAAVAEYSLDSLKEKVAALLASEKAEPEVASGATAGETR